MNQADGLCCAWPEDYHLHIIRSALNHRRRILQDWPSSAKTRLRPNDRCLNASGHHAYERPYLVPLQSQPAPATRSGDAGAADHLVLWAMPPPASRRMTRNGPASPPSAGEPAASSSYAVPIQSTTLPYISCCQTCTVRIPLNCLSSFIMTRVHACVWRADAACTGCLTPHWRGVYTRGSDAPIPKVRVG